MALFARLEWLEISLLNRVKWTTIVVSGSSSRLAAVFRVLLAKFESLNLYMANVYRDNQN